MVDVDRILKNTVKKGVVHIGAKQTKKAIHDNKAKLVIISSNSPYAKEITTLAQAQSIPVFSYEKNSVNLGYACGKHFPVSVLAVVESGDLALTQLVQQKKVKG